MAGRYATALFELAREEGSIDRVKVDPFDVNATLGAVGLRVEIDALAGLPTAGKPPQRPKVRQRIRVDVHTRTRCAVPLDLVCFKELTVTSGNASTPASWERALTLIAERRVALEPLLSGAVPLADWEQAFDATRSGAGIKYVLVP